MKATLALALLAVSCVVVSGCGSSHRTAGIGPYTTRKGFASCGVVRWSRDGHPRTVKRIPCSDYHPVRQASQAPYAYQLPIDPGHPENGQWSTLVRMHPVEVGYRLRGIFPREWVVVAVNPLPQDGQPAAVRGWRGKQNPIWHGKLVLLLSD